MRWTLSAVRLRRSEDTHCPSSNTERKCDSPTRSNTRTAASL